MRGSVKRTSVDQGRKWKNNRDIRQLIQIQLNLTNQKYRIVVRNGNYEKRLEQTGKINEESISKVASSVHPSDQAEFYRYLNALYMYATTSQGEKPKANEFRCYNTLTHSYTIFHVEPEFKKRSLFTKLVVHIIDKPMEGGIKDQISEIGRGLYHTFEHNFFINLSMDLIEFNQNEHEIVDKVFDSNIYSEEILSIRNKYIYPKDREEFWSLFSFDSVNEAYESNKNEIFHEVRMIGNDGEYHWYIFLMLFNRSIKETKRCILCVKNIDSNFEKRTKEYLYGERSATIVRRIYSTEVVVELLSDSIYEIRSNLEHMEHLTLPISYSSFVDQLATDYIYTADRERFRTFLNSRVLRESLKSNNVCETYVRLAEYAEHNEEIRERIIVSVLSEENEKFYIIILAEEVPYTNNVHSTGQQREYTSYTDLVLSSTDVLIRIESKINAVQYIRTNNIVPKNVCSIQVLYHYLIDHVYKDDQSKLDYFLYRDDQIRSGMVVEDSIRFLTGEDRYDWVKIQFIFSKEEEADTYFYFTMRFLEPQYPSEQADTRSLDYENVLSLLKCSVVCVDITSKTYFTTFFYEERGRYNRGEYEFLMERIMDRVYRTDKEWVRQKLNFEHMVQDIREGNYQFYFRIVKHERVEWCCIQVFLYQDKDNKEIIYLVFTECTQQKAESERNMNQILYRQGDYYNSLIQSKEDQICLILESTGLILFECNEKLMCTYISDTWTKEFGFIFDKQNVFDYFIESTNIQEEQNALMKMKRNVLHAPKLTSCFHVQNAEGILYSYRMDTYSSFNNKSLQKIIGVIKRE